MNSMTRFAAVLILSLLFGSGLSAQEKTKGDQSPKSKQTKHRVDVKFRDGESRPVRFLQFLPKSYTEDGETMPLMLFLHGRGECGRDLELVKRWGPPKLVEERDDFPFIVISPQCETRRWDAKSLKGLLNHVVENLNVDIERIYVTGLSMGGYGTWDFVAAYPQVVAAAVPICGGGDARKAEAMQNVPIWAFHGDADSVVPLSASQNIVNAIQRYRKDNVKLTIYEGVEHNSWEQTYGNEEIYEWLLQHRRKRSDE